MDIVRNDSEVNTVLDQCADSEENGSKYPGMSYEQGVRDTLDWLCDEDADLELEQ